MCGTTQRAYIIHPPSPSPPLPFSPRYRSHGNEQWQFDDKGLMERRDASINDVPIQESERRYTRNPKTGLVEYPHGHP